jgi:hypothetical protein
MDSTDHYSEGSSMDRGACSRVAAVADPSSDALALEGPLLCSLDSLEDLARWRDEVINLHRQVLLGTSAVPDAASCTCNDAGSRVARPVATCTLEALLAAGINRMRENGELAVDWRKQPVTSPRWKPRSTWR